MKSIRQNLQAVSRELKALSKKTESLMKEINKLEKSQPAKNPKKAFVKKKVKGLTETDKVLNIIKRSKKGVAVTTLKKKTGFNDKKISNIVFRAFKAGKIKRADKGVYMAA
ncbi:MAG: hypothetical protein P1P89_22015 [Desulfobacterales bacterium]|nr:hypothetical protein [Desulfobacterales bacterium]